jgi:hypothetical protein
MLTQTSRTTKNVKMKLTIRRKVTRDVQTPLHAQLKADNPKRVQAQNIRKNA